MAVSPITGREVEYVVTGEGYFIYRHRQNGFQDFCANESALIDIGRGLPFGHSWSKPFDDEETRDALNLIRSYLWRSLWHGGKGLLVTTNDSQTAMMAKFGDRFMCKPFEDFIVEARNLTFEEKALRTLENIQLLKKKEPNNKDIRYVFGQGGKYHFRPEENPEKPEDGYCYGCDESNGYAVLQYLDEEGFVSQRFSNTTFLGFLITHKGTNILDQRKRTKPKNNRSAFFVRKYKLGDEVNAFLKAVTDEVSLKLNCPIKAVWEDEHIGKIDERIFRQIRDCAVILVNVSHDKFNVGLEMGYAMALGKPIVCIRQMPHEKADDLEKNIPFDIATVNVYDYEIDKPTELAAILEARIGLALDLLKLE